MLCVFRDVFVLIFRVARVGGVQPAISPGEMSHYNQTKREGSADANKPKERPNFKPTGLLAKDSNNVAGVQLKYTEPQDSAPPEKEYILFLFSEDSKVTRQFPLVKASTLIGRDEQVVDLRTDDESCSKQHAVVQFRNVARSVKPYIIDLESSNGTFINGEEIPTSRFVELKQEDVLRFGESETDYVLMGS